MSDASIAPDTLLFISHDISLQTGVSRSLVACTNSRNLVRPSG